MTDARNASQRLDWVASDTGERRATAVVVASMPMSDSEHEYLLETEALREEAARLRTLAVRALRAAIAAQDSATGRHDEWLEAELTRTENDDTAGTS